MTDRRAHLAEALRRHYPSEVKWQCGGCDWEGSITGDDPWTAHIADVLLSISGIAIVELPEYNEEYGCFSGGGYPCNGDPEHVCGAKGGMVRAGLPSYMPPSTARSVAAALLAAANAAELVTPPGGNNRTGDV